MVSWIHAFAANDGSREHDHLNFGGHSYYGQVPPDESKKKKGKNNYGNAHLKDGSKFKVMAHLVRDVLKSITSISCSEPMLAPDYQSYIRRYASLTSLSHSL